MKNHSLQTFITLFMLILPTTSFARDCSEGKSEQHKIGPEVVLDQLRDGAKNGSAYPLFFENGEFDSETFTYIGKVTSTTGKNFHLAFLETIWGASCRRTSRLMVFSEEKNI